MMQHSEARLRQARIALPLLVMAGMSALGATPANAEKVQNPIAIFAALDKVTGRISISKYRSTRRCSSAP